ncbi:Mut7-C RNAse domain-containing protein [Streptomyces ovatisporus]|uniref:Mut7-C RNAse domain-containing protein n=1 Tax=Streptomyces ovatisporus TaxID=1128682 RepID=UPI0036DC52FF
MRFAPELRFFLAARHRRLDEVRVPHDGTSTLGHVVQSLGVPLTEVGELTAGGRPAGPSHRPGSGETVSVLPVRRPQDLRSFPAGSPPSFVLDVHLGALARRLRLLGLDSAYHNDMADDALVEQAGAEGRLLLTQDRGLLQRRSLWLGAYVRGARPDAQLLDVLDRFAPPLAPWTRCMACNGTLTPVPKSEIAALLRPGTRRTYQTFMRCRGCGRLYWRGAHSGRLEATVTAARDAVRRSRGTG